MGLFKRITATLTSTVDQAVTRVENHDAVVAAAIKSTQSNAAKAKVRLARVQKDGKALRNKAAELRCAEKTWAERATSVAAEDKEKALECMKRRKLARTQLEKITTSLKHHDELEAQVVETLRKIEARLTEMKQQRNMMRSRETAADAMRIINSIDGAAVGDIDETFDRWEISITESEMYTDSTADLDALDTDFVEIENRQELEAELEDLLSGEEKDHEDDSTTH